MPLAPSDYRRRMRVAADFLASRRNPDDAAWGLNVEDEYQGSSIVNTAEALFVINRAGRREALEGIGDTQAYLRAAVDEHRVERGDRLRYIAFGVLGLLEAGVPRDDPQIIKLAGELDDRCIDGIGWAERPSQTEPRLWQTIITLWVLAAVRGTDPVLAKYSACLETIRSLGERNGWQWGRTLDEPGNTLADTAYGVFVVSLFYPDARWIVEARQVLAKKLTTALEQDRTVEIESIAGTDWRHYGFSWAVKALHTGNEVLDEMSFLATLATLRYVDSLWEERRGWREPSTPICNVRSTFNCALAIDAILTRFDPSFYFGFERFPSYRTSESIPRTVFLSYSYRPEDEKLVETLRALLRRDGWNVIEGAHGDPGSLAADILAKIRKSERMIVLLTARDQLADAGFTTSAWLLEEKGAFIALGRRPLLLIEESVAKSQIGGIQGDDRWLSFTRDDFHEKALEALDMLSAEHSAE